MSNEKKDGQDAFNDSGYSSGVMGDGNGDVHHAGWIRPHPADRGHRRGVDQGHSRPKGFGLTEAKRGPVPTLTLWVMAVMAMAGFGGEKGSRQVRCPIRIHYQ